MKNEKTICSTEIGLSVLMVGDSRIRIKELADNSIDSVVTDPPYELGFMGKKWDNTGIAYDVKLWKEVLRVLKPGGHLLSFGGTRTYHRMVVAIEDAGFEIRDMIEWVYGSGFPKSMDIGKAFDKQAGAKREVIGIVAQGRAASPRQDIRSGRMHASSDGNTRGYMGNQITSPATAQAHKWNGWGTALKPAHEPIVVARKPLTEKTVCENLVQWGTGGINIDKGRISPNGIQLCQTNNHFDPSRTTNHFLLPEELHHGTLGRFPANFIHDGSAEVVAMFPTNAGAASLVRKGHDGSSNGIYGDYATKGDDGATFYADNGTAARFFKVCPWSENDLFPLFYCAKASKSERNKGCNGLNDKHFNMRPFAGENCDLSVLKNRMNSKHGKNHHPTVKPLSLMNYLIGLVTPPNGTTLDLFAGSGTTLLAAQQSGFGFIGIEKEPEYIPIIKSRIENGTNKPLIII